MTCTRTHTSIEPVFQWEDWDTGEPVYKQQTVERSLFEDIDIHRMKCSRCGLIRYYSGAARDYYENGKPNEIVEMGTDWWNENGMSTRTSQE